MTTLILVDTGPLVALLNRRDDYHEWATSRMEGISLPVVTCESVLSEACFLVRHLAGGTQSVLKLLRRGVVSVGFSVEDEAARIERLLVKYADVPMSLADACLVRMAEQHAESAVMTLDRDFLVYRRNGRQVIPTVAPWS